MCCGEQWRSSWTVPGTPHAIVINEALEIARKFSTPESVQFINGVLDSVGKDVAA